VNYICVILHTSWLRYPFIADTTQSLPHNRHQSHSSVRNYSSFGFIKSSPHRKVFQIEFLPSSLRRVGIYVSSDFTNSFHLFQGLPWSRRPFGLNCRTCIGIFSSVTLSRWFIQFCLCSFVLFFTGCILISFLMSSLLVWSCLIQPLTVFNYLISTDCIPFIL
jgi:hypothetical protein